MSSLFKQISQAAAQQRQQVEQLISPEAPVTLPTTTPAESETLQKPANNLVSQETRKQASPPPVQEPGPPFPTPQGRSGLAPEKQGNKEAGWQESKPGTPSPGQRDGKSGKTILVPFTPEPIPGRQLTKKQTFELHKAQIDFMDQAKFELRALGVSKEEMVRTGLELLAKDYATNKKSSYLFRKFASREVEEEPQD